MTSKTKTAARIHRWPLAAVWMRAVANACGYTPETAKPLGLAYATARRRPREYEREAVESLPFAGLWFLELDDRVYLGGESIRALNYDCQVIGEFPDEITHHKLFYAAVDAAESWSLEKLDQTDFAWRRFEAGMGGRRSLSFGLAHELVRSLGARC